MRVVDQILRLCSTVTDEEISEALQLIATANASYGTLWGAGNIQKAGLQLDGFNYKAEVLEFIQKVQKNKLFCTLHLIPKEDI